MDRKRVGRALVVVVAAFVVAALGFVLGVLVLGGPTAPQQAVDSVARELGAGRSGGEASRSSLPYAPDAAVPGVAESADSLKSQDAAASQEQMIVRNAAMELRIDSMEETVKSLRRIAKQNSATVTDLSITAGDQGDPRPLAEGAPAPSPSTGWVTLRVPAEKLEALQEQISGLGKVVSQSVSANDVTQQYVDLTARLENLKAEEARLRAFLTKTDKVSELLEVERELSRVRGEIESMQAQVDYLERQVSLATLMVTLTEPGPVLSSAGSDWGFGDAIRRGIHSAVKLITGMLTLLIALTPLIALGILIWALVRWIRRRRTASSAIPSAPSDDDPSTLI